MPRTKTNTKNLHYSSTPPEAGLAFGQARDELDARLLGVEEDFLGALDAHEQMQAATHSPRAVSVLFQKQADMRSTVRRLQRLLERLA